jgi:hypothetical protein
LSEYAIYLVIATIGCLVLVLAELKSHRLGWWKNVRLALIWLAIFAGLYLLTEWFLMAQDTASALI